MDPSPPVDDMETEFIGDGDDQDKSTSSKRSKGEENNANNNNSMETPSKFPIGDPHSNMKKEKATVAFKEHNLVQYLKENIPDLKTSNAIKITRKILNEKGALEDVDMVSFLNRSKGIYENEEYDCINYSCYICFYFKNSYTSMHINSIILITYRISYYLGSIPPFLRRSASPAHRAPPG